ncbi:hypothetical protein ACHAXR_001140 [Thalassiosira sp. AJA248-18]
MRMENGNLASNDKQNIEVTSKHLEKVYNTNRLAAKLIQKREQSTELGTHISWKEFERAVAKLKNREYLQMLSKALEIELSVVDFWEGRADYWECHTDRSYGTKKGDLSDPNKWRGINLMGVCSKVLSSIRNERCFKQLEKHGTKTQFGGTPGVGCQDGNFTTKTLLHQQRQHNLPSFVAFVDL